jgi:hypothetical protein
LNIVPFVIVPLAASIVCLSQTGFFDNLTVWAQAVPLIPIQSGNATLDQGLPVFYDCLEEVVDESFSEQEDSYFKEEPRKSEVVECYYEVFVNNNGNSNNEDYTSHTESNDINDNNEESGIVEEEDAGSEGEDEETLFG